MTQELFIWLWGPSALLFVVGSLLLINRFDKPRKHRHGPAE